MASKIDVEDANEATIEDTTMDEIMKLSVTNPTIRMQLERVQRKEIDYGTAIEELVIELANQIQMMRNNYRGLH